MKANPDALVVRGAPSPALGSRLVFFGLLCFVGFPSRWTSPTLALALGVGFGMLLPHPYAPQTRAVAKTLLQLSVVGLGFAMDLHQVLAAGRSGFFYTLASISFALLAGMLLGRVLEVPRRLAYLISVGTAICGGSAIAAVGPSAGADDEEMTASIGTVFILNAVGLLVFPLLGHALGLSERQFGEWAALAIHDTSSVVGAAEKYGPTALTVATTVKLARALWIVPVTFLTARVHARSAGTTSKKSIPWPWFILFFLGAAVLNTYVTPLAPVYPWLARAGRTGLALTLFLIGTGVSRATLRRVGVRPLLHGVVLWIVVAGLSLLLVGAQ
jgi:uncharacterized integral membrane protein (TIGR00698 family)